MLFNAIRTVSASRQGYGTFDPDCRECEVGEFLDTRHEMNVVNEEE